MTYLPLSIGAICIVLLGIWIVSVKKEKRKEFLTKIGMLIVATLLSFSIALSSVSLSAQWQVKQEKKATVVRLFSIHKEALENRSRIAQLIDGYIAGEVKDIQFYVLETRHIGFVGSESYYRCSLTLRTRLEETLECLQNLNTWIGRSHGEVDQWLARGLRNGEKVLESCVRTVEKEGKKMDKATWTEEWQTWEKEKIVE